MSYKDDVDCHLRIRVDKIVSTGFYWIEIEETHRSHTIYLGNQESEEYQIQYSKTIREKDITSPSKTLRH